MPRPRNWIVDLARPHLASPILEVGAGTFTGGFTSDRAVEPGGHAATVLTDRYAGDRVTAVRVRFG